MPNDQHQIIATPRDRWQLTNFLLRRKGLSFKGRQEQKILHRAKTALGLHGPAAVMMGEKPGTIPLANDRTPSLFVVIPETVEFFGRCLEQVTDPPMLAAEMDGLEPVLQQLESREHAAATVAAHPDAGPLGLGIEDWTPLTAPILENPSRFVEVLVELVNRFPADPRVEPAFAAFQAALREEAEVPKPGKTRGGRLQPGAEQAPS